MADYPTTAVPFSGMPLSDLRDPVLAGRGSGGLIDAAESYRQLGDLLTTATEDLRVAMIRAREAHEGGAAELAEQHVNRILAVGELGAGQAQITAGALHDGAGFYARVRDDMAALPEIPKPHDPRAVAGIENKVEANKVIAVEASERYERNANWALGRQFPLYEAPIVDPPGVSVAGAGGAPGGVGGAGGTGLGGAALAGSGGAAAGGGLGGVPAAGGPGGVGVVSGPVGGGSPTGPSGTSGSGVSGSGVPGSGGSGRPGPGGTGAGAAPTGGAPAPRGPVPAGPGRVRPGAGSPLGPATGDPGLGRAPGADGRPGGGRPDPAVPPSSGWQPGQPWSSRALPDPGGTGAGGGGGGYAGPGGRPNGIPTPGGVPGSGAPGGPASGSGPGRGTAGSGVPFFPGAGAGGRGGGDTHARPSWLLEDDPQSFWFAGMPEFGPGVIGGEGDGDH